MASAPDMVTIHEIGGLRVGVCAVAVDVGIDECDVLLTDQDDPPRPWVTGALPELERAVQASPAAAVVLAQVLRATEHLAVAAGLTVESLGYSVLQHGARFRAWLDERPSRPPRPPRPAPGDPVLLQRVDDRLDVVLQRPEVHNALSAAMRDALIEAFELVDADPAISAVHLRGAGPSFCSGGHLDEFGTARDAGAAHLLRVERSVGRRVHEQRARVTAHLHGACVGAGIELAAFAGRVVARPDTLIRLPELGMGLIPGAGGTVSIPRRIGRHRTAFLALTGGALDAATALRWGLVDELDEDAPRAGGAGPGTGPAGG